MRGNEVEPLIPIVHFLEILKLQRVLKESVCQPLSPQPMPLVYYHLGGRHLTQLFQDTLPFSLLMFSVTLRVRGTNNSVWRSAPHFVAK